MRGCSRHRRGSPVSIDRLAGRRFSDIWGVARSGFARPAKDRFTSAVQFEVSPAERDKPDRPSGKWITVGSDKVPLQLLRNPRARRYILRLRPDGTARVTIPRRGSAAGAGEFVARHISWLEHQVRKHKAHPPVPKVWRIGSTLLLRGELTHIHADPDNAPGAIQLGAERIVVAEPQGDLRPAIERHLRAVSARELPERLLELAALHGFSVRRIMVRNQRTRWGSCSRRGTISLNWRLIQTPPSVRDYICLHELMHLRQMNHSPRFWQEVESVCPDFQIAERWLKAHSRLLAS